MNTRAQIERVTSKCPQCVLEHDRGSTESPLNLQGFVRIIGHYLLGMLMFLEQFPFLFKVYVDTSCVLWGTQLCFPKAQTCWCFLFFFFFLRQYLYLWLIKFRSHWEVTSSFQVTLKLGRYKVGIPQWVWESTRKWECWIQECRCVSDEQTFPLKGEFLVLIHLCNQLQANLNSSVIWQWGVEHLALSGPKFSHWPFPLLGSAAALVPVGFVSSWPVAPAAGAQIELPTTEDVKMCLPLVIWRCAGPAFPAEGKAGTSQHRWKSPHSLLFQCLLFRNILK